jgi:hypothetical protein
VNRVEIAEAALKNERAARENAERSLSEAQATIHDVQTKLGHLGLARDEAITAARHAEAARLALQQALDEALATLAAERQARQKAENQLAQAIGQQSETLAERRRGRPRRTTPVIEADEPEPVKWWIRSETAKAR